MVAFLTAEFLFKELTYVIVVQMDGRHHDMRGFLSFQLDDTFAEVGLDNLNATFFQIGIHLTLFREHRL